MRKIFMLLINLYFGTTYSQVSPILKHEIDSIVNANYKLMEYKKLIYCDRIRYIDSLVLVNDVSLFGEDYIRYAIIDLCLESNVKSQFDNSSWSLPAYNSKEKYFKISKKWKAKNKCKNS